MIGKKKSPFAGRRVQNEEMSLQITSMADIFIIILVFLIKSFTSGVTVSPSANMMLPAAEANEANLEALKVEISETAVSVEGKAISLLKDYHFDQTDIQANGSSKTLSGALEIERKRQLLIAKANADVKVDPKILVIADQRVPYTTVKSVLASAALNGYTDFKLAVIKGN